MTIQCPICGADLEAAIYRHDPFPSSVEVEIIGGDCECSDSNLVRHDAYMERISELALAAEFD